VPFAALFVLVAALAGIAVARRRGWPVVPAGLAAGLIPPLGLIAIVLAIADRAVALVGDAEEDPIAARHQRTRETTPARREVPPALASGGVMRALKRHGPMTAAELHAALTEPAPEVRTQLDRLVRLGAVVQRGDRFVARD
jgi:hypothetical protein